MVRIIFKFKLPKTEYVLSDFTSMITGKKISGPRLPAPINSCAVSKRLYIASFLWSFQFHPLFQSFFLFVVLLRRELVTRSRLPDRSIGINITCNFCHIPSVFQYIFIRQGKRSLVMYKYTCGSFDRSTIVSLIPLWNRWNDRLT